MLDCVTFKDTKTFKFFKAKTENEQKRPEEPPNEEKVQNESVNIEPDSPPKKTQVSKIFLSVFKQMFFETKRKRQPKIFKSFGQLSRLKDEIEELIDSITDPSTIDYF